VVEPSEVAKVQAKVRLVRLDAEGNPVDGSTQVFRVDRFIYKPPATVDDSMMELLKAKQVSMGLPLENVSPEFVKLLMGEG
jgi:hypothetical protein